MAQELEKIAGNYKSNQLLRKGLVIYNNDINKPLYLTAIMPRSVEYDCDSGDSCDGDGGCDGGCDGGD
ncbi:TPA: hypothetical protein HA235_00920 [Candidatus Woesearchaeota archaeon]|nr:hypothetical protein [Candidatus Woesearchaeota archaeon]HIH31247.1 hypothetical protein [Candidatus Woesearchaeota archaeon]HIJ13538.1 hypothetical protein [Candidatus Woesearchaeota archaeon]